MSHMVFWSYMGGMGVSVLFFTGAVSLLLVIAVVAAVTSRILVTLRPTQPLAVVARGPPALLQTFL